MHLGKDGNTPLPRAHFHEFTVSAFLTFFCVEKKKNKKLIRDNEIIYDFDKINKKKRNKK